MQLDPKNKILIILAIFTITSLGAIWGFASISERIDNGEQNENTSFKEKVNQLPSMKKTLKNTVDNEVSKNFKNDEGRVNVLLLGISGKDHKSGELTDSIMLVSVDTKEKKVDMFSIPRDLWVSDNEGNFQKINELYKIDGGTTTPSVAATDLMKSKMEEITGQPIHYSSVINLDGVEEIVDIAGGVETEEGLMNGEESLKYIRDRSRPGGDFDRMARQQKLILAILQKFKTLEFMQDMENVQELYEALERNLAMDVSFTEMAALLNFAGKIDPAETGLHAITPQQEGLLYSDFSEWEGFEVYTLHPRAGMEDYSEIQEFINKTLNK